VVLLMVDVFISYSRSDQAMVAMLARAVEAAGYQVWWDAELPPHQSYGDVITDKIAEARAAIVVWSASAVKSEWVRAEADMARNQRKLIQTALDNVTPPLPFNQIQYAEMGDWRGEDDHPAWRKVKLSLAELCDQRGTSEPSSAPSPPPGRQPLPPAASQTAQKPLSRAPLFAGIAVAVVALAVAGGVLLGRGGAASAPAEPVMASPTSAEPAPLPQASAAPASPVAAPVPAPAADEPPAVVNPADMTFPDSSTRLLTPADIATLGPTTLRVARNEIYARKGRRFQDPWLRNWFSRYAWYRPTHDQVTLNPIEQHNVELLEQAELLYR